MKESTPEGHSTVCPYLVIDEVALQLDFLKNVFDAEIIESIDGEDGKVIHAEARIGNSIVMMGQSNAGNTARESMNYMYVDNADNRYAKAMEHGSVSLNEPVDRFYGIREAGIKDPCGNQWWFGHVVEQVSKEELQRRMSEEKK